jgi:[ribosomal protein S5]-alanine N-acetyltransferase
VTVTLRRWRVDDTELVAEGALDEYTALIEGLAREGWLDRHVKDRWAHVIELDGDAVGGISASRRHVPGIAELGYWVVERARRQNAATEAAIELCRWLLQSTNVERLQATVEPWNVASRRVLEKAGFQREGLLRGYASWGGGRRDVELYARLAADEAPGNRAVSPIAGSPR